MTNFLNLPPGAQATYVAELTRKVEQLEQQVKGDRAAALWASVGGYEDSLKYALLEMTWDEDLNPSLSPEALESLSGQFEPQQPSPQATGDSEPQLSPAEKLNALRAAGDSRPRPGAVA
ncbi:hypothetical protein C7293_13755 [filamentous cyanobacterium CCT1]|nr:hypothetical protein C7293_13755 [filamentous cyanobacterium CCT1]PSN80387.1 hypothetical protein C8B47_06685 [filamentous cyanobacterium CCP4]